jgi:polar amino acid transport system ATP-binding protein
LESPNVASVRQIIGKDNCSIILRYPIVSLNGSLYRYTSKVLAYDEPTSALDPALRQQVASLILELFNNSSISNSFAKWFALSVYVSLSCFKTNRGPIVRTLAGLETADSGTFLLDGSPFDPTSSKQQEQVVGVVFQDFQLFPHLSVMDNITIGPRLVLKQDKETYTDKANHYLMHLLVHRMPIPWGSSPSPGQSPNVASVRQIIGKDNCLILELKADGVTQIVVTHDLDFAEEIGDKVLKVEPIK